ncbi:alpha/beta hydrolase [Phytopseudomonas dryadis]|uniref:Alpha/beta hydrolase n=1 Tax=Phytopseudomonas dryadis TaxID=2487520 RepID=A0ABY1YZU6_9GAMM|nr:MULTISPECIES: alpha/beta hydrolase [Pseudomonas]TBV00387.1 alpha/beta hydrolase [Pseudomonas dryadis]TBV12957.1 alpha/beta hydrolase [Pseudomonas sp. FRB 230]
MLHRTLWLDSSDGVPLYVNHWYAEDAPRAVLMVAHGMAEHSGRYARLGAALVAAGMQLYAHDQRGHGRTAEQGTLGHYADHDGWEQVVDDLASLNHHIRQQHPRTPIFLLGHSMGSYIGMAYLMRHSSSLQGAILSGSNYQPLALYRVAALIARFERWRQGATGRSALIERLSFGAFNKAFRPNRTAFDWLSRDPLEVDRYLADPLCGFRCSNQLWLDLLGGLQHITPPRNLAQIDPELPILVIGGECDPLSQGRRLQDLANALGRSGHARTLLKMYPQARHELLNERNRDEVTRDLIDWLEQALQQPRQRTPRPQEPHA